MLFALALAFLFLVLMALLLYVLEDSFIDRRLATVAVAIVDPEHPPTDLPAQFTVTAWSRLPDDIRARLAGHRTGYIAEFRRGDGRYVHARLSRSAQGEAFAVVYDVTDELTVNPGLRHGLPFALALLTLILLSAYVLARVFAGRVAQRATQLVQQVLASPNPAHLLRASDDEPVLEFGDWMRLHAAAWQAQLDAVTRERETLAYLGHELRTPLQSARTSLALLAENRGNEESWSRLQRAIERLVRASTAILWLASDAVVGDEAELPAQPVVAALVAELQPLARAKGQTLTFTGNSEASWHCPREPVETLIANLMLNAIQHGGAGIVEISLDTDTLTIRNPLAGRDTAGFGVGLQVVRRLVERLGWSLELRSDATHATCTLQWRRR